MTDNEARRERQEYVERLFRRVIKLATEASPGGLDQQEQFWDDISLADDAFCEAAEGYVAGIVDKEELDSKATGYLTHWKELACRYRSK